MLYFSKFFVPDPFIALKIGKRKIGILNALEFSRAHKESDFDRILLLEHHWDPEKGIPEVVAKIANQFNINHFQVPYDFPAGIAFQLNKKGITLDPIKEIFPRDLLSPKKKPGLSKKAMLQVQQVLKQLKRCLRSALSKTANFITSLSR